MWWPSSISQTKSIFLRITNIIILSSLIPTGLIVLTLTKFPSHGWKRQAAVLCTFHALPPYVAELVLNDLSLCFLIACSKARHRSCHLTVHWYYSYENVLFMNSQGRSVPSSQWSSKFHKDADCHGMWRPSWISQTKYICLNVIV